MSWSIGKLPTIGFLLASAVLITSTALSYYNFKQVADNEAQVVHTHEVLDALAQTLASVTDAETGQRGYVIKVIRRKNPRRSQIVYRDELQLALLPQKEANRRR